MGRLAIRLMATTAFCLLAFTSANAAAVAPSIVKTSFSAVGEDSATLSGEINPGERFSEYHFEYGAADCASNACTSAPVPDGSIPSGNKPVPVSAEVTGLSPGTTYHFRLVAKNADAAGGVQGPDKTFTTFPVQPPFGACPNDALRLENPMKALIEYSSANLPDCRAYEQVSPTDKNGSNATGTVPWVKASPDGSAFSFLTTSGMAGAEGSQVQFPTWVGSKAGGGWSTQGLPAPASSGQAVEVLGWLPDFSVAFEYARREGPPKTAALLARDSSDGSITAIVPYHTFEGEPAYSFIGASADGQTVFFESNEKLTDEAIAGRSNVYAWGLESKALSLVSQLPEEECATAPCSPPAGAFGGAYEWMSQSTPASEGQGATKRGGAAAGNYNQDLHAVSADGRYAYFTAANTGQLYLRSNPTAEPSPIEPSGKCEDPELACTLRVSASKKTNGLGPSGTDAAGPRPAAFMAASADAKKTFFTSPEKLTDNANTGTEPDASPTIARSDLAGTPASVELGFLPQRAMGVSSDGTHLYWADPVKGSIGRAKLNGEEPPSEVEDEFITREELEVEAEVEVEVEPGVFEPQIQKFANPRYLAVDETSTYLYWTNPTDGKDGDGTIGCAKLGPTGSEDPKPEFITGANNPSGIDVDETSAFLYWGNAGESPTKRTIGRAKLGASCEPEEVLQGFLELNTGARPEGIAVNATHIYAAVNEFANSSLARYDIDGDRNSWKPFFDKSHPNLPGSQGIALDASHVYWTRPWAKSIGRIDLALEESSAEREFIDEAGRPSGLALDSEHLYWSANQEIVPNPGNDLYRFDAETEALEDLTPDPLDQNGAEVKGVLGASADGSQVYFVANAALAAGSSAGDCVGGSFGGSVNYSGECSLYLWREGAPLQFIARLSGPVDAADWLAVGQSNPRVNKASRVSPDGKTLLFLSRRQLTDYVNEEAPELYRFRLGEGIGCVSCSPIDAPPRGAAELGSVVPPFLLPSANPAAVLSRNLSADGNRVFFETIDALVPGDTNGNAGCPKKGIPGQFFTPTCLDVYEWESEGTGSCKTAVQDGGCIYLISTGKSSEASSFGDASLDGSDAFVFTYAKLVGQDQDQLMDVYDASVEGGLVSQNTPAPPKCESTDACQPPPPGTPPSQSPGSESFSPDEVKQKPRACPKGKRKVRSKGKTRCVAKKQKGKAKAHKRAAKKTGRAVR
jgi:hypothetical protein